MHRYHTIFVVFTLLNIVIQHPFCILHFACRVLLSTVSVERQFAAEDTAPATIVITGTALVRDPVSYTKTSFGIAPPPPACLLPSLV